MTSHPEFNEKTTATVVASVFAEQIRNKNGVYFYEVHSSYSTSMIRSMLNTRVVVITGIAPKSLGEAMAVAIAAQSPAKLFLASRTKEKLEKVANKISNELPQATPAVELVALDLASQQSIQQAASQIANSVDAVDVLINNAGVMTLTRENTADGLELQFGTNHIGHFLFTQLLIKQLLRAGSKNDRSARVINVTSEGHRLSPIRFHDYFVEGKDVPDEEQPPPEITAIYGQIKDYNGWLAYGQSKTANSLFSLALNQKLKSRGMISYAVHPGSIWTNLNRSLDEEGNRILAKTGTYWKSEDEGAATMLVAAFDPLLNDLPESGDFYLNDCQFAQPAPWAKDTDAAEKLYTLSEELLGRRFDESVDGYKP
ncbi:putative oxidoreductase C736,13 [Talaromyces islandicus]|uniref:Putative oxidoreductase C736,13 n=1 Tax=Talaromyces islandicus TaxID=28573 RepID=A0A0U1M4L8_TALIS|nr:putative oxidoreductase C736,13 [Talaromyces islandicus]